MSATNRSVVRNSILVERTHDDNVRISTVFDGFEVVVQRGDVDDLIDALQSLVHSERAEVVLTGDEAAAYTALRGIIAKELI